MRELNKIVLSSACEPASITLGDAISVLVERCLREVETRLGFFENNDELAVSSEYRTQDRQKNVFKSRANDAH